jgi:3-deoxy-7-phosphoheptulonate synthase
MAIDRRRATENGPTGNRILENGQALVLMMTGAPSDENIGRTLEAISRQGLESSMAQGQSGVVISVEGDGVVSDAFLASLPGVDRTVRTTAPYRLVSASDRRRSQVRIGNAVIGASTFSLIAGPCAIECGDQAWASWDAAAAAGATMHRGDLFKHRTSPYAFQGLGSAGVEILAQRRERSKLPIVVEVLDPDDIPLVADVVDVIRVGTRNMQNVALLRACAESGKPIMLKRGLTATIEEWLLAAEYIAAAGNLDIILCERGIRTFEPWTRNTLDLSAVAIVQQRSHLPVIVDPSHASGSRDLVAPMSLAAIAAGADGVMIDVHPRPAAALCDGPQAMLPEDVVDLGQALARMAHWLGRTPGITPALSPVTRQVASPGDEWVPGGRTPLHESGGAAGQVAVVR